MTQKQLDFPRRVTDSHAMKLTKRELATLTAALRYYQADLRYRPNTAALAYRNADGTDGGKFQPISTGRGIDRLLKKINR